VHSIVHPDWCGILKIIPIFARFNVVLIIEPFAMLISFTSDPDLVLKIISLQRMNLRKNLSPEEISSQGFLYVEHDPETLQDICKEEPAVVAMEGDELAGYAICMNKMQGARVPELAPFFNTLDSLKFKNTPLHQASYMVCGQICVSKAYRGQNLVRKLYDLMSFHRTKYKFCITEISTHNNRSLKAHFKVGFVPIHEYVNAKREPWQIVIWDWEHGFK